MAITVEQWVRGYGKLRRNYARAILGGMRAGLLLGARAARERFIATRTGPPLPDKLTHRTGRLRKSIRHVEPLRRRGDFVGGLSADTVYARVHERGGRHHPKRPYLAPAVELVAAPEVEKQILIALNTLARDSFKG